MSDYECEECGETFKSSGKYASHVRWEHQKNTSKDSEGLPERYEEIEIDAKEFNGFYKELKVKTRDKSPFKCSECGNRVKPTEKCAICLNELNWYAKV